MQQAVYRRHVYIAMAMASVLMLVGGYFAVAGGRDARGLTAPSIGGPFRLIDGEGQVVTDGSFKGRFMLVYFGYTFCPDVCPTTLTNVADAMDRLGSKADKIQPVFITVDPTRDTPKVVKQYAAMFSPHVIGLSGSAGEIADAARAYRVYYAQHRLGPDPNDYSMDHSSILYVMGPDGAFVSAISAEASGAEMAAQLGKLLF